MLGKAFKLWGPMNFSLPSKVAKNKRFGVKKQTPVFLWIFFGKKKNGCFFYLLVTWLLGGGKAKDIMLQKFSSFSSHNMFGSRTNIEARSTHLYMSTIAAAHQICNHIFDILTEHMIQDTLLIFNKTRTERKSWLHMTAGLPKKTSDGFYHWPKGFNLVELDRTFSQVSGFKHLPIINVSWNVYMCIFPGWKM